ncbi:DNA topoisomerase VI subunit B [Candidatus Micrarchaeota archaeon]|nr:DNA topoisomerase VI subunit B [Candidatus Micrarchaeota archaeon]
MEKFEEYSVAEFFKKNKQMLGFSGKIRSLTTIVHEYITNSVDACEENGILPEIEVNITEAGEERYKVRVRDNGPGITKENLGKAFGMMLAGTKFHRYVQQRGQQGIGAAGCTMYAVITTGQPVHVISGNGKKRIECNIGIDFKENKPVITNLKEEASGFRGIIVEGEFGEVKYGKGEYSVDEYLKRTALANPHISMFFKDPAGGEIIISRATENLPRKAPEVKPHPLGLSAHDLLERAKATEYTKLSSFLQNEFSRVSLNRIKELAGFVSVDLDKNPKKMEWKEAVELIKGFKKIKWIAPATDSVVPIGKEQIERSLRNVLDPEYIHVTERSPKIYRGGVPFIVEVGIGYGGSIKSSGKIMRFANRTPLLFDSGGDGITQTLKTIDWRRYGIKNFDAEPVTVLVNIASVHIPYTTAGKQSIAPEKEITDEIKNAVMEAGRSMGRYLSGRIREKEKDAKRKLLLRYVKQLSGDIGKLAGESPEELEVRLKNLVEERY